MRERKISQETIDKLIEREAIRAEITALTAAVSLMKYQLRKVTDELDSKISKLQLKLTHPEQKKSE